jgi:hypothetical protein
MYKEKVTQHIYSTGRAFLYRDLRSLLPIRITTHDIQLGKSNPLVAPAV